MQVNRPAACSEPLASVERWCKCSVSTTCDSDCWDTFTSTAAWRRGGARGTRDEEAAVDNTTLCTVVYSCVQLVQCCQRPLLSSLRRTAVGATDLVVVVGRDHHRLQHGLHLGQRGAGVKWPRERCICRLFSITNWGVVTFYHRKLGRTAFFAGFFL
jgi:hypothetical protein